MHTTRLLDKRSNSTVFHYIWKIVNNMVQSYHSSVVSDSGMVKVVGNEPGQESVEGVYIEES